MKKALLSLAALVLVALSSAQYYKPPEQESQVSQAGGQEVLTTETGQVQSKEDDPPRISPRIMNQIMKYADPEAGDQTVDEQERLRQEKALLERDQAYFRSVLGNKAFAGGGHSWAKKELAKTDSQIAAIEKQLNDITHEMRSGLNKHAKQIGELETKVDGIWESEKAREFETKVTKSALEKLKKEPQKTVVKSNTSTVLVAWIGLIVGVIALLVAIFKKK